MSVGVNVNGQGFSYIIGLDGSVCYALNCLTGKLAYGGVGDAGGVDGDSSVAVFQAVINACWPGQSIFVRKGNYSLSGDLTLRSYTVMIGENRAWTKLTLAAGKVVTLYGIAGKEGTHSIVLRNLRFIGQGWDQGQTLLTFDGLHQSVIDNVTVLNCAVGLRIDGVIVDTAVSVYNNWLNIEFNNANIGIHFKSTNPALNMPVVNFVVNSVFLSDAKRANSVAIWIENGKDTMIVNPRIEAQIVGVQLDDERNSLLGGFLSLNTTDLVVSGDRNVVFSTFTTYSNSGTENQLHSTVVGVRFVNRGTAIIDSGGNSETFSSGLVAEATHVKLTLKGTYRTVGAISWSATHPNITVSTENNAAGGDQSITWEADCY